jgi:hypothetical protein
VLLRPLGATMLHILLPTSQLTCRHTAGVPPVVVGDSKGCVCVGVLKRLQTVRARCLFCQLPCGCAVVPCRCWFRLLTTMCTVCTSARRMTRGRRWWEWSHPQTSSRSLQVATGLRMDPVTTGQRLVLTACTLSPKTHTPFQVCSSLQHVFTFSSGM